MAEKEIKVVGADLDSGITTITMSDDVSDADINEAVEEAGFKVE